MSQEILDLIPEKDKDLISPELEAEVIGVPHSQLLNEAFDALNEELQTHGNTEKFLELRQKHAAKLLTFWRAKLKKYDKAIAEGLVESGDWLEDGEERLLVQIAEAYEDEDTGILFIKRKTKTEKDEVYVTASKEFGLDEFLRPPQIKSEIRSEPEEDTDLIYEVIFRKGRISTFKKTKLHFHLEYQLPWIKTIEIIDASHWGGE